jgi:hypothetical protein
MDAAGVAVETGAAVGEGGPPTGVDRTDGGATVGAGPPPEHAVSTTVAPSTTSLAIERIVIRLPSVGQEVAPDGVEDARRQAVRPERLSAY